MGFSNIPGGITSGLIFPPPVIETTAEIFVALSAGIHLLWFDKTQASFRVFGWTKAAAGIAAVVIATLMIGNWMMMPGLGDKYEIDGVYKARLYSGRRTAGL